jgi:hypothetical protein
VLLLDLSHGRIAADSPRVEVLSVAGKLARISLQIMKIIFGYGMANAPLGLLGNELAELLKVFAGWPAAVVSYSPEKKACFLLFVFSQPSFHPFSGLAFFRIIMVASALSEDLRAIIPNPDKIIRGKAQFIRIRPAEKIRIITGFLQNLHQTSRMPKRVKIDSSLGLLSKLIPEINLASENLANKRFAAGHVAVRLQKPSAHDMPSFFSDQFLDLRKQLWLEAFHPFIEQSFIVVEDKILEFLTKLGGCPEGGKSFGSTLFPFPQPDRVDVGVAEEIESLF